MRNHNDAEEQYWQNHPYKDSDFVFKQEVLRGEVMYDRLTNPGKFRDYEEWTSKVAGKFVAYKNAYEMLKSDSEYAKRAGKLAVQMRDYKATMPVYNAMKRVYGRIKEVESHLSNLESDIAYHQRAFDAIQEVESKGLSLTEIKMLSEAYERKYWDVVGKMESGYSNNPKISEFKDILKEVGGGV